MRNNPYHKKRYSLPLNSKIRVCLNDGRRDGYTNQQRLEISRAGASAVIHCTTTNQSVIKNCRTAMQQTARQFEALELLNKFIKF